MMEMQKCKSVWLLVFEVEVRFLFFSFLFSSSLFFLLSRSGAKRKMQGKERWKRCMHVCVVRKRGDTAAAGRQSSPMPDRAFANTEPMQNADLYVHAAAQLQLQLHLRLSPSSTALLLLPQRIGV